MAISKLKINKGAKMSKVIVITGASSGIGEQLKNYYETDGNTVINLSLGIINQDIKNYNVDVSNKQQVCQVFQKINSTFGNIDVLINCAGYAVFGAVELLSEEKCKQIFDVNYFGTLWCVQEALKYMKSGSKIINISSAGAMFPLPFRTMYSASKVAVMNLSFGLRMELKNAEIKVACICPGDIKTNFSKNRDITLQTSPRYKNQIQDSYNKIQSGEHKRMNKEYACKKIYKICNKKSPKAMYVVGKKYKFLNFVQKFISKNMLLKIIQKKY